jgi:hypothetical protein
LLEIFIPSKEEVTYIEGGILYIPPNKEEVAFAEEERDAYAEHEEEREAYAEHEGESEEDTEHEACFYEDHVAEYEGREAYAAYEEELREDDRHMGQDIWSTTSEEEILVSILYICIYMHTHIHSRVYRY